MAKSRRHAADRLLLGGVHGGGGTGATDLPDLAEEDVFWAGGDCSSGWFRPEPNRPRPWPDRRQGGGGGGSSGGGLSLAHDDGCAPRQRGAASAPMEVPAWPSYLRNEPAGQIHREEEEEGGSSGWVPPHEYLAREKGRSAETPSVLEGAGRTLKGRDMSRVRDAVWGRTGFFG